MPEISFFFTNKPIENCVADIIRKKKDTGIFLQNIIFTSLMTKQFPIAIIFIEWLLGFDCFISYRSNIL